MSGADVWSLVQLFASAAIALIGAGICAMILFAILANAGGNPANIVGGMMCCYGWMFLPGPVMVYLGVRGMYDAAQDVRSRLSPQPDAGNLHG